MLDPMSKSQSQIAVLILLSTLVLNACTHSRTKKFESALEAGRCEAALENIPENDGQLKFLGRMNRVAGSALSYAATGAGYTADVIVTVAGGAIVFVALCGPVLVAESLSQSGHSASPCLPVDISGLKPTQMGSTIYKDTEELRCPDLTALSRSVRRVAACNENASSPESLARAKQSLTSLNSNPEFMNCITKEERSAVRADIHRLTEKLGRTAS